MMLKILYIIGFVLSISCFGQEYICKKKKRKFDLTSISKCVVINPNTKKNRDRTITTRPRIRKRTRIRKRKKNNKIALQRAKRLASKLKRAKRLASELERAKRLDKIRKATELASKIKITTKTIETLPLSLVEIKPLFSNCEGGNFENQTKCFKEEIANHIKKHFKYPDTSYKKGIQGRVLVNFVIDEKGLIKGIKTSSPFKGEELNKEAIRIIKEIPKFKVPGKIGSNTVKVKCNLSINFQIEGVTATNTLSKYRDYAAVNNVKNMTSVDKLPLFKKCRFVAKAGQKKCFVKEMINHINRNIEYPTDAVNNNIQGRIQTQFVITKEGYIVNIITSGPEGTEDLREEAKRIMSELPKLTPAKFKGKAVNVKHTLPITFKL